MMGCMSSFGSKRKQLAQIFRRPFIGLSRARRGGEWQAVGGSQRECGGQVCFRLMLPACGSQAEGEQRMRQG